MLNPRRVLTRAQLLDHVWDYDFGGDARVLETYVSYLRKKLDVHGPSLIHTVRGVGYALRPPRSMIASLRGAPRRGRARARRRRPCSSSAASPTPRSARSCSTRVDQQLRDATIPLADALDAASCGQRRLDRDGDRRRRPAAGRRRPRRRAPTASCATPAARCARAASSARYENAARSPTLPARPAAGEAATVDRAATTACSRRAALRTAAPVVGRRGPAGRHQPERCTGCCSSRAS